MRIGLDLLYLLPGETGGRETYARELLSEMLRLRGDVEFVAFVNREAGSAFGEDFGDRVRTVVLPISGRSHGQWALGELAAVALAAWRQRVRLVHSMANFAPVWGPFKRVVTIHDLQFQALPELLSPVIRMGTAALVSAAARRADRIITGSNVARVEIAAGLKVAPAQIDVVPHGVRIAPVNVPADEVRARYRLGGKRPVVLTVATNVPHKNLPRLLEAVALIAPSERPMLALVGHRTDDAGLRSAVATHGLTAHVRLLGRCSAADLDALYGLASAVVLPTLHEGFGLPVIEAMARSAPVLCSDIPVLREVGGTAALYFDPRDPASIANRIRELLTDDSLRADLRERGQVRARAFTWAAAAAGTLASYARALEREPAPGATVVRRTES